MGEVELPKRRFKVDMLLEDTKTSITYAKGLLFDECDEVKVALESMTQGIINKVEEVK